jgi:hypothetical protein
LIEHQVAVVLQQMGVHPWAAAPVVRNHLESAPEEVDLPVLATVHADLVRDHLMVDHLKQVADHRPQDRLVASEAATHKPRTFFTLVNKTIILMMVGFFRSRISQTTSRTRLPHKNRGWIEKKVDRK